MLGVFDVANAIVRLRLDSSLFDAQLDKVHGKVEGMTSVIGRISPIAAAGFGAAAAAAAGLVASMGASVKVAGDLQAEYADLQRVSGLTAEQTDALATSLKGIAKVKPGITLNELNKVASFAARQGLGGDDPAKKTATITEVTRSLADLKLVITDMDIETASTQILRALNVFKQGPESIRSFASALVAVDNASTASAPELLDMIQRMSGSGKAAGASIPHLLALAGAARDMGVPGDVASTALDKLMSRLQGHTEKFAKAVHLDGKMLGEAFEKDPVEGISMFLTALSKMSGKAQALTLEGLSMEGQRTGATLQTISAGMDKTTRFMKIADEEWKTQKSLEEGVAIKSKTVWAQWSLIGNQAVIMADNIGKNLLPAFAEFIKIFVNVEDVMNTFMESNSPAMKAWSESLTGSVRWVAVKFGELMSQLNSIPGLFREAWSAAAGIVTSAAGVIRTALEALGVDFRAIGAAITGALEWIKGGFKGLREWIDAVGDGVAMVAGTWRSYLEEMGATAAKAWKYILYSFNWAIDAMVELDQWLGKNFEGIVTGMADSFGGLLFAIEKTIVQVMALIAETISQVSQFLADPLHFKIDLGGALDSAVKEIKDAFDPAKIFKDWKVPAPVIAPFKPADITQEEDDLIKQIQRERDAAMRTILENRLETRRKDRMEVGSAEMTEEDKAKAAHKEKKDRNAGKVGPTRKEFKFETYGLEELHAKVQGAVFDKKDAAPEEKIISAAKIQAQEDQKLREKQHREWMERQKELRQITLDEVDRLTEAKDTLKEIEKNLKAPRFAPS